MRERLREAEIRHARRAIGAQQRLGVGLAILINLALQLLNRTRQRLQVLVVHLQMRAAAFLGEGSEQLTNLIMAAQAGRRKWQIARRARESISAAIKQ